MTELSGTIDGLGLPAIVRFLGGLQKTGSLHLEQDGWQGELAFDAGRLTHAKLGSRTGLAALDGMVEALPRASFVFDSHEATSTQSSIDLDRDAVLAHLDEVAARVARGESRLPPADAVPTPVASDTATDEPVQVDRAALQTLLAVDGHRTVREIVELRGSLDALWHLGRLLEAGLIQLGAPTVKATMAPTAEPSGQTISAPPLESPATVVLPLPPLETGAQAEAPLPNPDQAPAVTAHCPKLGFEDEPSSSFGRPTRLHRCFATGRALPLSLDQQRELCLSEQHSTCPRLLSAASPAADRPARSSMPRPASAPDEPSRIVRLPVAGRPSAAQPERDAPAAGTPEPRPLRPLGSSASAAERANTVVAPAPTPLRARLNRTPGGVAAAPPLPPRPTDQATDPGLGPMPRRGKPLQPPLDEVRDEHHDLDALPLVQRRVGPVPLVAVPAAAVAVLAVAALVYLLAQFDLFNDGGVDPTTLPNASLVEAGTPVASLRLTPVPARGTPAVVVDAQPTAEPTLQPTVAAAAQPAGSTSGPAPSPAPAQPSAPLFDENFTSNDAGWPSNPVGAALITNGAYRIVTRQAGQFASVSAPVANIPSDVVVSATFRKLAGPPGGGYGIIVRDQETTPRDGTSQGGQYYVFEAGDKGEVGIWRRDDDHWVDLLPWQHSDAVKTDTATNELVVRAIGSTFNLIVNGTSVATQTDATLSGGRAGLFVGGDGNQVAVGRFTVQAP